jgi:hypothetical protein
LGTRRESRSITSFTFDKYLIHPSRVGSPAGTRQSLRLIIVNDRAIRFLTPWVPSMEIAAMEGIIVDIVNYRDEEK